MKNYILVIDEGTTGVRVLLFNRKMKIVGEAYKTLELIYPGPEEVEVDALDIYEKTTEVCKEAVKNSGISPEEIEAVGVTSQRATWLFWDKVTGKPIRNAVTWQDGRGIYAKEKLMKDEIFNKKWPGLAPALPGFWGPLILYKITNDEPAFAKAIQGENILFGHIEDFLVWKLTQGSVHAASRSSASSTGVYITQADMWNEEVYEFFGVRKEILPEIKDEADDYGKMDAAILGVEIPIRSSFADQQAALFSQGCLEENTVKCTLGTGGFVDFNLGEEFREIPPMLSAFSWNIQGRKRYCIEGMLHSVGACLEWAKNQLHLFDNFEDMEKMAACVESSKGLYFVPALAGISDDTSAKGAYMGIRPDITNCHLMRATLEGVAFGVCALVERILKGNPRDTQLKEMKISGGVSKSDLVVQTIANVLDVKIVRPQSVEATALGAAEAAAIGSGWMNYDDVNDYLDIDKIYEPDEQKEMMKDTYIKWKKVVERTLNWDM